MMLNENEIKSIAKTVQVSLVDTKFTESLNTELSKYATKEEKATALVLKILKETPFSDRNKGVAILLLYYLCTTSPAIPFPKTKDEIWEIMDLLETISVSVSEAKDIIFSSKYFGKLLSFT